VQSPKYGDIYKISETKVESEEECCDGKCGIHIISSQVQERGTYFPTLQEVYPYAINKHVSISVTMVGSKATVRVDNQHTPAFPITNGVRQGDALSSILFDLVLEAIFQKMNITGYYYYYYRYSALGPVLAETRAHSGDWYGSGTLHPGQILRGSLPLLSPRV
jgi:hypothetical protein